MAASAAATADKHLAWRQRGAPVVGRAVPGDRDGRGPSGGARLQREAQALPEAAAAPRLLGLLLRATCRRLLHMQIAPQVPCWRSPTLDTACLQHCCGSRGCCPAPLLDRQLTAPYRPEASHLGDTYLSISLAQCFLQLKSFLEPRYWRMKEKSGGPESGHHACL